MGCRSGVGAMALAVALLFVAADSASAAPGDLDSSFSHDGVVEGPEPGYSQDFPSPSVAVAPDGKVIVAGEDRPLHFALARYDLGGP